MGPWLCVLYRSQSGPGKGRGEAASGECSIRSSAQLSVSSNCNGRTFCQGVAQAGVMWVFLWLRTGCAAKHDRLEIQCAKRREISGHDVSNAMKMPR